MKDFLENFFPFFLLETNMENRKKHEEEEIEEEPLPEDYYYDDEKSMSIDDLAPEGMGSDEIDWDSGP